MMQTISTSAKKFHKKRSGRRQKNAINPDVLVKLYELVQGEREMVKFYSKSLDSELCFVNPALQDVEKLPADVTIYTTRELSFVLSMNPEELQRYHYLKMKLA